MALVKLKMIANPQNFCFRPASNGSIYGKYFVTHENDNSKQDKKNPNVKESSQYLSADKIKKMLIKFLCEKGMSEEELAGALKIQVVDLEKLLCCQASYNLIAIVNLPLITLYCGTKFNNM